MPRERCASAWPCSAAKRYQRTASLSSRVTPLPFAYITPRLYCSSALPNSAKRVRANRAKTPPGHCARYASKSARFVLSATDCQNTVSAALSASVAPCPSAGTGATAKVANSTMKAPVSLLTMVISSAPRGLRGQPQPRRIAGKPESTTYTFNPQPPRTGATRPFRPGPDSLATDHISRLRTTIHPSSCRGQLSESVCPRTRTTCPRASLHIGTVAEAQAATIGL